MRYIFLSVFIVNILTAKAQDPSIIEEFETIKIGTALPKDMAEKYFDAKPDYYGTLYPVELDYFKKCQDNAVVIITRHTGVSSYSDIGLISRENGINTSGGFPIMDQMDHDGAFAVSESMDYKFINPALIEITELMEVVKDSSKFDPVSKWIKGDDSFWDLETETFENYWYIKIEENCRLIDIKPRSNISKDRKYKNVSLRLLSNDEIKWTSNFDLRIMRNEIFADYGYKFKSADLDTYFRKQPWYKPQFDDVTLMLTELERMNIEIILRQEEKNKSD